MSTKMKGILKGLRYISHIFEDQKEPEMQIGLPTDVKHVAHIGWDGPSVDSPSWMNKFDAPGGGFQSAPLSIPDSKENPEVKWVSEDSSSRREARGLNSPGRGDQQEQPKSTRRRSSADEIDSPRKEKSRNSRRHHSKDSSDSVKLNRHIQVGSAGSDSPSRNLPDIPKKSRRKKSSKGSDGCGSSGSSRLRGTSSSTHSSTHSDPGTDIGSSLGSRDNEICQPSRMKPLGGEEEKESSGFS